MADHSLNEAIAHFNLALELSKYYRNIDDSEELALVYQGLASAYTERSEYSRAKAYLLKGLESLSRSFGTDSPQSIDYRIGLAKLETDFR